jgi:Septum formation
MRWHRCGGEAVEVAAHRHSPGGGSLGRRVFGTDLIRAASMHEPHARIRAAIAGYGRAPVAALPQPVPKRPSRRRRRERRRRVPIAGAVILLLVLVYGAARHARSLRSGLAAVPLLRGHCYTWDQGAHPARRPTPRGVSCSTPHLFEAVGDSRFDGYPNGGSIDGAAGGHVGGSFPTRAEWQDAQSRICGPLVSAFLPRALDVRKYAIGGLVPTRSGWRFGDRTIECGIISVLSTATEKNSSQLRLAPFRGAAEDDVPAPASGPSAWVGDVITV